MKKTWVAALMLLSALCFMAPFASEHPDAIQKVLRLPGGGGNFLKAAGGSLAAAALILLIGFGIQRLRKIFL